MADNTTEITVDGALCTCTGAVSPAPQKLKVQSNQKLMANGATYKVATTSDKLVSNLNFGSCKLQNPTSPPPCAANIIWQNFYKNVSIQNTAHILTIKSTGQCSFGGMIQIKQSGQSTTPTPIAPNTTAALAAVAQNPLLKNSDFTADERSQTNPNTLLSPQNQQNDITIEPDNTPDEKNNQSPAANKHKAKVRAIRSIIPLNFVENQNTKAIPVKQPSRQICTFKASANESLTWEVRDSNLKLLKSAKADRDIRVQFPRPGRYIIDAYAKANTISDNTTMQELIDPSAHQHKYYNTLIVDVVDNYPLFELLPESQNQVYPCGSPIKVQTKALFPGLKMPKIYKKMDVRLTHPNGSPFNDYKKQLNNDCFELTIQTAGNYLVQVFDSAPPNTLLYQKIITLEKLKIKTILIEIEKAEENTFVPASSPLSIHPGYAKTVRLSPKFNINNPPPVAVSWQIQFAPTQDTAHTNNQAPKEIKTHGKDHLSIDHFDQLGSWTYTAKLDRQEVGAQVEIQINPPQLQTISWHLQDQQSEAYQVGLNQQVTAHVIYRDYQNKEIINSMVKSLDITYFLYNPQNQTSLQLTPNAEDASTIPVSLDRFDPNRKLPEATLLNLVVKQGKQIMTPITESPICITRKEAILSIAFFKDKNCSLALLAANYGDTIYARVQSRNLSAKQVELFIQLRRPHWYQQNKSLYSIKQDLGKEGSCIFEIPVNNAWQQPDREGDLFVANVSERGDGFFDWFATANQFPLQGKDFALLHFSQKAPPSKNENTKSKAQVGNQTTKTDHHHASCPNCDKDITIADLKGILKTTPKGVTDNDLQSFVKAFNTYKDDFGINTCLRKAHFLAQVAQESGFKCVAEKTKYHKKVLIETFHSQFIRATHSTSPYATRLKCALSDNNSAYEKNNLGIDPSDTKYKTTSGVLKSDTLFNDFWNSKKNDTMAWTTIWKEISKPFGREVLDAAYHDDDTIPDRQGQIICMNYVYFNTNGNNKKKKLDDATIDDLKKEDGEGYLYRGRGYIQLTGKGNYDKEWSNLQTWFSKLATTNVNWEATPSKASKSSDAAMLATLIYWYGRGLISLSDDGDGSAVVTAVTRNINAHLEGLSARKEFFKQAIDQLQCKQCPDYQFITATDNPTEKESRGTVVVIDGAAIQSSVNGFGSYPIKVYRDMTLDAYKKLEAAKSLPNADFESLVSRDACEFEGSHNKKYPHQKFQCGQNTECPPGEYFLNHIPGKLYKVYVSDKPTGACIYKWVDDTTQSPDHQGKYPQVRVKREGIALHWFDASGSVGCITFQEKTKDDKTNFNQFYANVSDIYNQAKQHRPVHLILKPRTDVIKVAYKGINRHGKVDIQYLFLSNKTVLPDQKSSKKKFKSQDRLKSAYFEDEINSSLGHKYKYIGIANQSEQTSPPTNQTKGQKA